MSLAPPLEAARSVALPASPYVGLDPYDEGAAAFFFGRSQETSIVAANLRSTRLTILYGPSGVGKSSLLMAGVVHSLHEQARFEASESPFAVCIFRSWRDDPMRGMREASRAALQALAGQEPLPPPGATLAETLRAWTERAGTLLVVLDQFEEYFQYNPDEGDGAHLTGLAAEMARVVNDPSLAVHVLLSIREDAWAKLDRFEGHIPLLFANYLRVDHLELEAAREAIEGPIAAWNRTLMDDERPYEIEPSLVDAVLTAAAGGELTLGAGSDGTRIETPYLQLVMQRLWDEERSSGSHMLRVETLERLGGAQHIVEEHLEGAMAELTPGQKDVASRLFNHLVTPSGTKIAHEVADLADFGQVSVVELHPVLAILSDRRILRSVEEAGDVRYEIFHDVLAEPVLAWRARHRTEREIERQLADAHRRRRRLQSLFALVLVALGLMAGITVYALSQRAEARGQARMSRAHELEALSAVRLAADPELSLVLAVEAARLAPSDTAAAALRNALLASRVRTVVPVGEPLLAAALRRGRALSATADGRLVAADGRTGRILGTTGGGARAKHASFAANGTALFTGRDGRLRRTPPGGDPVEVPRVSGALRAEISRDGRLAVVVVDGGARLVDLETGMTQGQFSHPGAFSAAISDRNGRVATGSSDGSVRVWAAREGALLRTIPDHGHIQALSFTPVGTQIASASSDGLARIWIIRTGGLAATVAGDATGLTDVGFSTDAAHVVTASKDGTVRVSKADTGAQLLSLSGHGERVTSAVFSGPVGSRVVSASLDGTARIWDALYQPVLAELAAVPTTATDLVVGDDGRIRVTAGTRTYVLDPDTGERISIENADRPTRTIAGPGGMTATIRGNTVVLRTPEERSVLQGHRARVFDAAFSPDGTLLATASKDGDVRLWTIVTGESRPLTHNSAVRAVAFSPDGRWLVTAAGRVGLWDPDNGLVVRLQGHDGPVTAIAFDPSGRNILSGGVDGTVRKYPCNVCGDVEELVEMAETRLAVTGRARTDEERERYFGN